MIESWILAKLEPLRPAPLIILRDPQRLIQPGAHAVDGWGEEHGYTVLFCTGNLALREMVETVRGEPETKLLLVDRSRADARIPLFYPDLATQAGPRRQQTLSLRDYLVEATGDTRWPHLLDDRQLARRILANLPATLTAYQQLRIASPNRFSDSDLYRIVLGATLGINPFRPLSSPDLRRLCIEQHQAIRDLQTVLPDTVMQTLRQTIAAAPPPFCWLLDRDPVLVVRAFTLAAILRQHGLDYGLLLANLDPALAGYRDIDPAFLDQALADQLAADPDRVLADIADAEAFLVEAPERLAFLLAEQLQLDDVTHALDALRRERLSPLIRRLALVSLLADLLNQGKLKLHKQVMETLDKQAADPNRLTARRPSPEMETLEAAYRRAFTVRQLAGLLPQYAKRYRVTALEELTFAEFAKLWNDERINRLDYYTSELDRILRIGNLLPTPRKALWPTLEARWQQARQELKRTIEAIEQVLNLINARFQDLYQKHYAEWIRQPDAPAIFTHQFLPRVFKTHWDPQSHRKAVILVFDGLRTDAWDELVRPVLEERFQVIASYAGSALIPTETQLSRKAISASCLPWEFVSQNELKLLQTWLRKALQIAPQFEVVIDDDAIASGMSVRYVSDQIEYIVFNFTDENLHHNQQDLAFIYNVTVREIIQQDVRSVLRELPADALIFATSDHGFTALADPTITIPDNMVVHFSEIKYRNARTQGLLSGDDARHVIGVEAKGLGIPLTTSNRQQIAFSHILFARPGYTLRREGGRHEPDRYGHGGISLAECLVPMIVLGPKQHKQTWLTLDSLRQAGAVTEGEQLTLEITVTPMQIGLPDIPISLTFSQEEIPMRREVFAGSASTYTVPWTPKLDAITEAQRSQGAVTLPVTVILTYTHGQELVRLSRSLDVRIKLDPSRLRRRLDSKLDLLMGKIPQGLA